MSERVWITLIVAFAIVLVVVILRRQLKSLVLKGMGMEAEVQTHSADPRISQPSSPGERPSVNISDVKQIGLRNKLNISRGDTNVERTKQIGKDQEINVTDPGLR